MQFISAPVYGFRYFGFRLLGSLFVFAVDQGSKWFIATVVMDPPRVIPVTPFFNLVFGFNRGVSFGLLGDLGPSGPVILSALTATIIAFLVAWLWRAQESWEKAALSLIIGGAAGNLFDRLRVGAVTDFLDLYVGQYHWPSFNLADVAITLGVGVIVISSFANTRKSKAGNE